MLTTILTNIFSKWLSKAIQNLLTQTAFRLRLHINSALRAANKATKRPPKG